MAARWATLRVEIADLEALRDALAPGEGVAQAAQVIASAEERQATVFEGPTGSHFRVVSDKPVALLWPRLTDHGEIAIPIVLAYLKGRDVTEAVGSVQDAEALIEMLQNLIDASKLTEDGRREG